MTALSLPNLRRRAGLLLALAGTLAGLATLPAAPAHAAPLSTGTFSYADLPDIDQERTRGFDASGAFHAGLPGGGLNYCAPAAAMDALAFLSDHGAGGLSPGSRSWTLARNYEFMTGKLAELGALMGTDSNQGTSQKGLEAGLQAWNGRYGTSTRSFGVVAEFPGSNGDSRPPNLGIAALAEGVGNPVILSIGYFKRTTITVGGRPLSVLMRTGGHSVTMTGLDASGLGFVDPDDAPAGFAQSAYRNRTAGITQVSAILAFKDDKGKSQLYQSPQTVHGLPVYSTQGLWKLSGWDVDNAYVEGYTVVQPSFRLTAKHNTLDMVRGATVAHYRLAGAGAVHDIAISPAGDSAFYALAGKATVYRLDLASGKSTALASAGAPVRSLAVDPSGETVYAAAGRRVSAVDYSGGVRTQTDLPTAPGALAYDRAHGQLDAVSADAQRLTVLGANLAPHGSVKLAGTALRGAARLTASVDAAGSSLRVQRADSGLLVATPISTVLTRLDALRAPRRAVGVSRIAVGSHRELSAGGRLLSTGGLDQIVRESQDLLATGPQAQQTTS